MTNDEIERIAIHAESACKCSFDDVDPVFAIRELQFHIEVCRAEIDATRAEARRGMADAYWIGFVDGVKDEADQ